MKVFVQAKNESVVINDEIIVTVLDVNDDNVILAVDAPEWIEVCEKETFEGSESMLVRPRCRQEPRRFISLTCPFNVHRS